MAYALECKPLSQFAQAVRLQQGPYKECLSYSLDVTAEEALYLGYMGNDPQVQVCQAIAKNKNAQQCGALWPWGQLYKSSTLERLQTAP